MPGTGIEPVLPFENSVLSRACLPSSTILAGAGPGGVLRPGRFPKPAVLKAGIEPAHPFGHLGLNQARLPIPPFQLLVSITGIEPVHPFGHMALNHACLPVPPYRHMPGAGIEPAHPFGYRGLRPACLPNSTNPAKASLADTLTQTQTNKGTRQG